MTRVAIAGAGGRMGQALIEATLAAADLRLGAALDVAGSPFVGHDAGERFGRATTHMAIKANHRRDDRSTRTTVRLLAKLGMAGNIAHSSEKT
jgi:dihydrodipicolinate reductase